MNVLVACECSGRVKTAFRERGHNAWSCDLKPSEIPDDKFHIQDDVKNWLDGFWLPDNYLIHFNHKEEWDLLIAHPDCTRITNSGVRWLHERPEYVLDLCQSVKFFLTLYNAPKIKRKCIENPIPHKYAAMFLPKYTQIVHPHFFGDKESKATCLWLSGLPELERTHWIPKSEIQQSTWREAPSPERKTIRSRTFQGIANAMAEQWGKMTLTG